ncbi:MBL fold metallo-hydrolase [Anaerosoma tenue]|uniref:MBL fold metallo-hydrolase n=1 Tax=Anaerosoma tenue TaxID=2933588 RepID=UPI002260D779|nr:MBL fold metallo-hydrolase [Anaerosoma tenue]MCK8114442.1 MBL fold metallo-hydrolase [Anaerosoma tenue]
MRAQRLTLGPLDTNCWLVDDGAGGPVLVVDPADDAAGILEALGSRGVAAVTLTHGHFDHLGAVREILDSTGAPLVVHEDDAASITTSAGNGGALFGFSETAPQADRTVRDGDVITAGELELRVIHTPGHTPGSICLYGAGILLSGDTLFAGSIGRTDFPGGDMAAMRRSIARLASLPDETRVCPGHGAETTIARERRVNPFFPRA